MLKGVSVIICSHRSPLWRLRKVIYHIREAFSCVPFEILLVSNGGQLIREDFFKAEFTRFSFVKLYSTQEGNLAEARRLGAEKANYSICLFLDDDNYVRPDYVAAVISEFESFPETVVVGCRSEATPQVQRIIHERYHTRAKSIGSLLAVDLLDVPESNNFTEVNTVYGAALAIRTKTLLDVYSEKIRCSGRSNNSLLSGDDTEICFKARKYGKIKRWNSFGITHLIDINRLDEQYIKKLSSNMLVTLPYLHFLYWNLKYERLLSIILALGSSIYFTFKFVLQFRASPLTYASGALFLFRNVQ